MDIVHETTAGQVVVLELEGELDCSTAPAVRRRVAQLLARGDRLLLDVSALTGVSGAGLRTLLLAYRRTVGSGGRVALAGVSADHAEIMLTTGFRHFFDCFETVADGLSALAA
ncbi:MAG TPA: STAS domain-containing protein [Actinocrinis sp.]